MGLGQPEARSRKPDRVGIAGSLKPDGEGARYVVLTRGIFRRFATARQAFAWHFRCNDRLLIYVGLARGAAASFFVKEAFANESTQQS